jgi:hypothetical protein
VIAYIFALVLAFVPQLPSAVIFDAIRSVAPPLPRSTVRQYARIIYQETGRRGIDPLLLVAFITNESRWNPRTKSVTNDFGLAQVHVAVRGSAKFLGREHELYVPRTNLREWSRLADMWRAYHLRTCDLRDHTWWQHLRWGYKVKERTSRIDDIYEQLKRRFRPARPPEV